MDRSVAKVKTLADIAGPLGEMAAYTGLYQGGSITHEHYAKAMVQAFDRITEILEPESSWPDLSHGPDNTGHPGREG